MKKMLIIKTGDTTAEIKERRGDFEDWFLSGMGIAKEDALVVQVHRQEELPGYNLVSGVLITGSHDMVTDRLDWSERTAKWLPEAVSRDIPILGVCYGHQLLAHAMGGEVIDNPLGMEFGNTTVTLTDAAGADPLLKGFPSPLDVQAGHSQTVAGLPKGAAHLASNAMDSNHAFRIGRCAWGIQFHPEFDADIMTRYINTFAEMLTEKGMEPARLIKDCKDIPESPILLRRFADIVERESGGR